MNKENRFLIGGITSFIILLGYLSYLCITAKTTLASNICKSTTQYYLLMLIIGINVFFVIKSEKYFYVYVAALFCFFIWLSFVDIGYSPIDEAMNFENINHIISYHTLSTFNNDVDYIFLNAATKGRDSIGHVTNYEAVQAPLYYIVFAIIGKFINNAYVRLHIFRLISLFSVFLVYFFIKKTFRYLREKNVFKADYQLFRMGLLFTIFNPGYLYRASRLNNEILVCVLMSILLYISMRCIIEGYSQKYYWILSIICVSLFLTKNTAIYAYTVFGIIVLLQKKIKEAILPLLATGALTIPWFTFNYNTYGHLTAMKEHISWAIPATNPQNLKVDLFDAFFNILPVTFFTGQEASYSISQTVWAGAFFIIIILLIIYSIGSIVATIRNYRSCFEKYDANCLANIICVTLILSGTLCLTAGAITTHINSILGRYFFGASITIIFLMQLNNSSMSKIINWYLCFIAIIVLSIAYTEVPITLIEKVYTNENLYSSAINNYELYDLSDDNWNHGYSIHDNKLLIKLDTYNTTENLQSLVGRIVSNEHQTALITDVAEVSIGDTNYKCLITNMHLDAMQSDNNILHIGEQCTLSNYNTGALDLIVGNIEGKEITQSILAEENGEIWGCEICMATYCVDNYNAIVKYQIANETGIILANGSAALNNIPDNNYSRVYFDTPINVTKGQKIFISLTYDNAEDLPLAVHASENDLYSLGSFYIDGEEIENQDIGIKILSAKQTFGRNICKK